MADLNSQLGQIKSNESFLERIARYIPGYDGYVNRDNSRELDTLLRQTLASKLGAGKQSIKNIVLNLSRSGKMFETDGIDKLDKKLQNVIAKLNSASRGYSGMFDVVKIKDEKLNMLYQFDSSLIDFVNEILKNLAQMDSDSAANTDIKSTQQAADALLQNMILKFDEREMLLKNL